MTRQTYEMNQVILTVAPGLFLTNTNTSTILHNSGFYANCFVNVNFFTENHLAVSSTACKIT